MTSEAVSDLLFTPAAKAVQARLGSREGYARMAEDGAFRGAVTPDLAAFLAERDSVYLATASRAGQPYVRHRGGPPGLLRVLDGRTIGWADYRGNRQCISIGDLAENPRGFLLAMDHVARARVKLWGRARVIEDDPALVSRLMPDGCRARPEQASLFTVEAWDANCPQHISRKVNLDAVEPIVRRLEARVAELERELAASRAAP